MNVKDIAGFRTWFLKDKRRHPEQWDEHFLGYGHQDTLGFFELMHGTKPDIRGFLTKEVQMAEDSQGIYEFIQNAADCNASHFWLFFDDDQFLVINNGSPFTSAGMSSILNVGQSEGKLTPGKIGRFGIGFKLVHRLVGETNGLDEMLSRYAGPVMFSWSQPEQFQQFRRSSEHIQPTPYDVAAGTSGAGDPWLLKILLTSFPALPGEEVRDVNYRPRVVFTPGELADCRAFLARHTASLDPSLFSQGTITYLRLGKGKADRLRKEEELLRRGVASSMHFLGDLQHIQLQDQPVARLEDLHFEHYAFPAGSAEHSALGLTDIRDVHSPVDIKLGFASEESAVAALQHEPVFYKYFPAGDETAPYTLVMHSNVLSVEANRRKLQDDTINQKLLRLAAGQLAASLSSLTTAAPESAEIGMARRIWAGLVLSDPPAGNHSWQKEVFYAPLLAAARTMAPAGDTFLPPDQVKIKRTLLPVSPADFQLSDFAWLPWSYGSELAREAARQDKTGLQTWDLEDLLPRADYADHIQGWLDNLAAEEWPQLRRELSAIPDKQWNGSWTRSEDKTSYTLAQRVAELRLFLHPEYPQRLSLQQLQTDPDLLLLSAVNREDQQVLEALGFAVCVAEEEWQGNVRALLVKTFPWLDNTRRREGSQALLERIRRRLPASKLSAPQKHRLLVWLAALPEMGAATLRKLALFRNVDGEVKPLDELVSQKIRLPDWALFARIHPDEDAPVLKNYLLQPEALYTILIHNRWEEWKPVLKPAMIAGFCQTVHTWYEAASDKSPLPGMAGALTSQGWLPGSQVFYQPALQQAVDYDDLETALQNLYAWRLPVQAMLPWLTQPPFQLPPDQLNSSTPTQATVLMPGQLQELLRLAEASALELTQKFTIRAHGSDYQLTPRQKGGAIPYFSTNTALVDYLAGEAPEFHLLPAGKLLSTLQRQVLHDADLYRAIISRTADDRLLDSTLISLIGDSGFSTVQRQYLDLLPELEFALQEAYPPAHPDRLLLLLAANPQVLPVEARAAFRRKLSLSIPQHSAFSLDGAAENDEILLPVDPGRTLSLSRAQLLPGSDQRSESVNLFAVRLEADEALRDLLGLGTPTDLRRLQDELTALLHPVNSLVQNATQLAFALLTARHARTLGTANLLPNLAALNADQQARSLNAPWYLNSWAFLDPAYILAAEYHTNLPALLGYDTLPPRWTIEDTDFELLRRPLVDRGRFHCPGLLPVPDAANRKGLLEFLYHRWSSLASGSGQADWPSDWSVIAGQPAETVLGFVPDHTVAAPGFGLPEEDLPNWVQEWAARDNPARKSEFLHALGVSGPASPVARLRQAFRKEFTGHPYELFTDFGNTSGSTSVLSRTLQWLQQASISITAPAQQALITELYRRMAPERFAAGVFTYLVAAATDSLTYRVLPEIEAPLLLDEVSRARLTEHDISLPLLLEHAHAGAYAVLDLSIYPDHWQQALDGERIVIELEYDRAALQTASTVVPLPRWQEAAQATVRSFPDFLPQLRTLLGRSLPDRSRESFWTDTETNNVYVTSAYLTSLPALLSSDPEVSWSEEELALLRQELLDQQSTQLLDSRSELLTLRAEVERLRQELEQAEAARRFAESLPVDPSARKSRPTGISSPEDRIQLSREARQAVREALPSHGYDCTHWHEEITGIHGVTRNGQPVPIVVKRVGGGVLYLTPNEWSFLASSPLAQLFVFEPVNGVRNISLPAVEARNQQFFMQFDVERHITQGIRAFADFFRYLPYRTHFIFDVPGHSHTDDFYQSFGLWQRHQPTEGEVLPQPLSILD